jgi:hypothetical protein
MRQQLSRVSKVAVPVNGAATRRRKGRTGAGVTARRMHAAQESSPVKKRRESAPNVQQTVCDDRLDAEDSAEEVDLDGLSLPPPSDMACSIRRNIEQYWEQKALRDALRDTFEDI